MAYTVGLDFGTHQTKVCIENRQNDRRVSYRFFPFEDMDGVSHVILPSVLQINDDDTVSYGFFDESRCKKMPIKKVKPGNQELKILQMIEEQKPEDPFFPPRPKFPKCSVQVWNWEDKCKKIQAGYDTKLKYWKQRYQIALEEYNKAKKEQVAFSQEAPCLFRYFKQASFTSFDWPYTISPEILSVWYLAYIILSLEKEYGTDFIVQMGAPTGKSSLEGTKRKAIQLMVAAYKLAEDEYDSDLESFLAASYNELLSKTKIEYYSDNLNEDYMIKVFPEAYASLKTLTTRGKIERGLNILVDIGGGTTDISFFEIQGTDPAIFNYSSLPIGINHIVEQSLPYGMSIYSIKSAFDAPELDETKKAYAVATYLSQVSKEIKDLVGKIQKTFNDTKLKSVSRTDLFKIMTNRPIVYAGGGSVYGKLRKRVLGFTELHPIDDSDWKGLNIEDFDNIKHLCPVLTIALGLSVRSIKQFTHEDIHSVDELFLPIKAQEDSDENDKKSYMDDDD